MKGFYDIEGTEICEGDEILYSAVPWIMNASELTKGTVTRFTDKNIFISGDRMIIDQVNKRIFILKGEFKTYSKKELKV